MNIEEMNLEEIQARKAEIVARRDAITAELETVESDALDALEVEADALNTEERQLNERETAINEAAEARAKEIAEVMEHGEVVKDFTERKNEMSDLEMRAQEFVENKHLVMETRQLLATGNIAKPGAAGGVSGMAIVASGIVDDVHAFALNGIGSWTAAYKASEAAAADVTDGSAVAGTASTYNYVTINPGEWGVLDEISKQVAKLTPVDYKEAIENAAVIALRKKAADKIIAALAASSLTQAKVYTFTVDYLRNLVLGFRPIEGKGVRKLYLCAADLASLGAIRGTNEKKAVFDIAFDDATCTSGIISEGGIAAPFRILDGLSSGTQYYGQPGAIDMPMWGDYAVETDEGGDYFKRNMIGIRGLQTAGCDLVAKYGMQKITQA